VIQRYATTMAGRQGAAPAARRRTVYYSLLYTSHGGAFGSRNVDGQFVHNRWRPAQRWWFSANGMHILASRQGSARRLGVCPTATKAGALTCISDTKRDGYVLFCSPERARAVRTDEHQVVHLLVRDASTNGCPCCASGTAAEYSHTDSSWRRYIVGRSPGNPNDLLTPCQKKLAGE